jgi:hypothetical protein
MKYLKKFESLESRGYKQTTGQLASQSFSRRGGTTEKFSELESQKIVKFVNQIGGEIQEKGETQIDFYHPMLNATVIVSKGSDEWFYVIDYSTVVLTWYECDGFEGLMKCLKDL